MKGALLNTRGMADVPETFELLLDGDIRRSCEIVWRSNDRLGIAFLSTVQYYERSGSAPDAPATGIKPAGPQIFVKGDANALRDRPDADITVIDVPAAGVWGSGGE
jgi:hypothetical protein